MDKLHEPSQPTVFCGVDVSAKSLTVGVQQDGKALAEREFANSSSGHKALIPWLQKRKTLVRVSLEATGIYSLDLALALHGAEAIEVAVLNPKAVHRFAQSIRRSKTDKADAQALAEYSRRMPFQPWRAPHAGSLQLRTLSRHIAGLTVQYTREHNRLHAAEGTGSTPRCIVADINRSLSSLQRREAAVLIRQDDDARKRFDLVVSIPGIAEISAVHILGELAALSPEMSVENGWPIAVSILHMKPPALPYIAPRG